MAGVAVSDIILEPLASAEAVLSHDERELGVALLILVVEHQILLFISKERFGIQKYFRLRVIILPMILHSVCERRLKMQNELNKNVDRLYERLANPQ